MTIHIRRVDPFTGKSNTWFNMPVTQEQIYEWENGALIQSVMPKLSPDQREFIMTGITPDSWEEHIAGSEESQQDHE